MKKIYINLLCLSALLFVSMPSMLAAVSNPPLELPTAPIHEASEVLSIYSDVYTNATSVSTTGKGAMPEQVVLGDNMLYFESGLGGQDGWSSIELATPIDISQYRTFFLDIYVVAGNNTDLRVRFGDETSVALVRVNEGWNKVEIDLSDYKIAPIAPDFTSVSKIAFFNNGGYDRTIYIDNVYASKAIPTDLLNAPPVQASEPMHNTQNVISIFSDKYPSASDFQIAGTATVRKVKGIPYGEEIDKMICIKNGLQSTNNAITLSNAIDIDQYDYLHLDVYVESAFVMRTFFGAGTFAADAGSLVVGWNSIDIELAKFKGQTNSPDLTKVKTFAFWNKGGYARNVYVDNIYAHKTSNPVSIISDKAVELSVYPNPVVDKVVVESAEDINSIQVFNTIGKLLNVTNENGSQAEIDFSSLDNGVYFLKISLANGNVVTKKILKK